MKLEIWKQFAIDELRRYNHLKDTAGDLEQEIEDINEQMISSASSVGSTPVQGGGNKTEDKYNNFLVKKESLRQKLKFNKNEYQRIDNALNKLSPDERELLTLAYINPSRDYIDRISQKYNIEIAQAYRYINSALQKYLRVRYGE